MTTAPCRHAPGCSCSIRIKACCDLCCGISALSCLHVCRPDMLCRSCLKESRQPSVRGYACLLTPYRSRMRGASHKRNNLRLPLCFVLVYVHVSPRSLKSFGSLRDVWRCMCKECFGWVLSHKHRMSKERNSKVSQILTQSRQMDQILMLVYVQANIPLGTKFFGHSRHC